MPGPQQDSPGRRCPWAEETPQMREYHDREWGFPVDEDRLLFERICLESFQCGLSWRTILEKRENFRAAFEGFDIDRVAAFTERDVRRLLQDAGIVRHRGKIEAAVNNARRARELIAGTGSLAHFFWRYEPEDDPGPMSIAVSFTPESTALSRELKRRGWRFVGPTTAYSLMQAVGIVNDHAHDCVARAPVEEARSRFSRPGSQGRP